MAWPRKVHSTKHNGEVFIKTNLTCLVDDCQGHLWKPAAPSNAHSSTGKYRTSADDEADRILAILNHNPEAGGSELLCMTCGYHSVSKSCIEISSYENDYSSLKT